MQQMKSNVALAQLIRKVAALRGNRQRGKVQVEHQSDSGTPDDFTNLQLASEMSTILDMDLQLDEKTRFDLLEALRSFGNQFLSFF